MATLMQAVAALRPGVNFSNQDGTLAGIRWDPPLPEGFEPPTEEEVDAEMVRLDQPPAVNDTRALILRRAEELEASPDLTKKFEGLKLRLSLVTGD